MKKLILFLAVSAMAFVTHAQTLTFQMSGNDNAVILNNGVFNPFGSFIGNTDGNTQIQVGEVDFGSGSTYKAVSIRYANGWGNGGNAIIKVGNDLETATEVARMTLITTPNYTNFRSLGANLTSAPTGVQKVFLTFEGRAGNFMDVRFYSEQFAADQFESDNLLKEPNSWSGYDGKATVLDINNSELIYSSSADTRPDNGSWGWTGEGVIVKYGDLDFGNGDYKQVVLELASHWQGDQTGHSVDVYIDDYNDDANLIANVWCGIDVQTKLYLARNIPAITGTHTVYLKWHGGSCNIANVHFVKDYLYSQGNTYYPIVTLSSEMPGNTEPSDNAVRYSFREQYNGNTEGVEYIGEQSGRTRILTHFNDEKWEANNVGYTCDRAMLRIAGVNFKQGEFSEIFARYATGATWTKETNFQFFLDTEVNKINLTQVIADAGIELDAFTGMIFNAIVGSSTIDELLESYTIQQILEMITDETQRNALKEALFAQIYQLTPAATVDMIPTGDWGKENLTRGDLSQVTGTHNVYVLYNADGNNGANLKDFWLSTATAAVLPVSATLAEIAGQGAIGTLYDIADTDITCVTSYKDGDEIVLVCKDNNGAAQQLPSAGDVDYLASIAGGMPASEYDHSNRILMRTTETIARIVKGNTLKSVRGKLNASGEIELSNAPVPVGEPSLYSPNVYVPASFAGQEQAGNDGKNYFFVEPAVSEYACVKRAAWDGAQFVMPAGGAGLEGAVNADFSLLPDAAGTLEEGKNYALRGIVTQAGMMITSISDDQIMIAGDLNHDGTVDVEDMNLIINMILGSNPMAAEADLTGEGAVDVEDMNAIINIILNQH